MDKKIGESLDKTFQSVMGLAKSVIGLRADIHEALERHEQERANAEANAKHDKIIATAYPKPTPTIERFELWEYGQAVVMVGAMDSPTLNSTDFYYRRKVGEVRAERPHNMITIWRVTFPDGCIRLVHDELYEDLKKIGAFGVKV
jgi:hypothetical protein